MSKEKEKVYLYFYPGYPMNLFIGKWIGEARDSDGNIIGDEVEDVYYLAPSQKQTGFVCGPILPDSKGAKFTMPLSIAKATELDEKMLKFYSDSVMKYKHGITPATESDLKELAEQKKKEEEK